MMSLLVFKERLKEFYAKFDIYITPVIKFVYSYLAFWLMNRNIGFMAKLTNPLVPLVLALACWALGVLCWAGLAWAAVGAGACRCWAGCPGHQAGCYPSYCTKFCLKIQHDAENDASCFGIFTA